MELNKVLNRVRKLVAAAEAPIAPGASPEEREHTLREQAAARKLADKLMLDYAIQEAQIQSARPAALKAKPEIIEIDLTPDLELVGWVARLAADIARHCRCQIRTYHRLSYETRCWQSKVYGFESDLRYFEVMYTTLRLHMIGALSAKPDLTQSLEDNAYRLHNAGLNWRDIGQAYGWEDIGGRRVKNKDTGEVSTLSKTDGRIKTAYYKACAARGEQPVKIPASGSSTFRYSAAQGYVSRIAQRLRALRENQATGGAAVVLRSQAGDLSDFFKQDNPDLFAERKECEKCAKSKSGHCRDHPRGSYRPRAFSSDGYQAGVAQANTASLNPEAGGRPAPAIGR
jgi:hypothetical protein